jgi:methylase of polypeptide subunit release factors
MSKKVIFGYLLVALLAFYFGTESDFSVQEITAQYKLAKQQSKIKARQATKAESATESEQSEHSETSTVGKYKNEQRFYSKYLKAELVIPPGVFMPGEAEHKVLPLLSKHADMFKGKRVMEIGTGSGPISLFAAMNGAAKVVSTDISPEAIAAITANAERLGVSDIIDARLVSLDDMGAYSVIGEDEQFDIIISNPPYALDLDAPTNTAATDNGELGFSIVRGFEQHLAPGGISLLFYDSLFYHQVMMKFARYEGYAVNSHSPKGLYTWAAETLFNSYLRRLLEKENMDVDSFRFVRDEDGLLWHHTWNQCLNPEYLDYSPLLPDTGDDDYWPGWMAITRNPEPAAAG